MRNSRLWVVLLFLCGATAYGQGPVQLTTNTLISYSGYGASGALIDAQDELPPTPPPFTTTSALGQGLDVSPYGTSLYFPMEYVIDLGTTRDVTDLCLYDFEGYYDGDGDGTDDIDGGATIDFEYGNPYTGVWTYGASVNLIYDYEGWVCTNLVTPINTRYLRFILDSPYKNIGEIGIYAADNTPVPYTPLCVGPSPVMDQLTMDDMFGVNMNFTDETNYAQAFGIVREFHYWARDDNDFTITSLADLDYGFDPSEGLGAAWSFDDIFQEVMDYGSQVVPAIEESPRYLWVSGDRDIPPIYPVGSDPLIPESYITHGDYVFQLAARYGSNVFEPTQEYLLKTPDKKSGLGLLNYIEDWSEQNKWWGGGYFLPGEYAAMSSGANDAHGNTIASVATGDPEITHSTGMKNADPNIKHVFAGPAGLSLEYAKTAKKWMENNRPDCAFPWDVLNFHNYATTRPDFDRQSPNPDHIAISPEADNLREQLEVIAQWRDDNAPGAELWLSEFGYDTNPYSSNGIQMPEDSSLMTDPHLLCETGFYSCGGPATCSNPIEDFYDWKLAEKIQGQWLTRSFMALAAAGWQRGMIYTMKDECSEDRCCVCFESGGGCPWPFSDYPGSYKFRSSGVIKKVYDPATGYVIDRVPKTAWYYVYTMRNALSNTQFGSDVTPCILTGTCADVNICPASDADAPNYVNVFKFDDVDGPRKVFAVWSPTSCQFEFNNYMMPISAPVSEVTIITMADGETDGVHATAPVTGGFVTLPKVTESPTFVVVGDPGPDFAGCNCSIPFTSVTGDGDVSVLVDEQSSLDFCTSLYDGPGVNWAAGVFPGTATLTFDAHDIEALHILDVAGTGDLKITINYAGGTWELDYLTELNSEWKSWMALDLPGATSITLEAMDFNADIAEVVLCGKAAAPINDVVLSGNIKTWCGTAVPNVEVSLNGTGGFSSMVLTNSSGNWTATVPADETYNITCAKTSNDNCGIDAADYNAAGDHFSGISPLPTGYSLIAADISGDQKLTNLDLVGIQTAVAGTIDNFSAYGGWDWKFLDSDFYIPFTPVLRNKFTTVVFDYNREVTPSTDMTDLNFRAVKAGDVNCDCSPTFLKNSEINAIFEHSANPNPFTNETTIAINVLHGADAVITVTDVTGRRVGSWTTRLESGANSYQLTDLHNAPAGMLSYTIETGDRVVTGKMMKVN